MRFPLLVADDHIVCTMIEEAARREGMSASKLEDSVKEGRVVLCRNVKRDIPALAVGEGCSTKVNANIGTSPEESGEKNELRKARAAVDAGADALMDLSVEGDVSKTRRRLVKEVPLALGTVPIYQVFAEHQLEFTLEDYLKELERHLEDGVDFVTIHAGLTADALRHAKDRVIPVTSRGGCFLASWMEKHAKENPLYTGFDEILELLKRYEATVSLGDGLRPACLADSTDEAQIKELKTLGELTEKAWNDDVKVIVEGPGHVPLDKVEENMRLQKKLCRGAPFYVLGPLVTDVAMGYDHISGAIGGALAAMHGADFLCYVTPSEHLGLPTEEDVREGVIASKIAAHAADVVKLGRRSRDDEMSVARRNLDWDRMYELALDPELEKRHPKPKKGEECTMCGKYCALRVYPGKERA